MLTASGSTRLDDRDVVLVVGGSGKSVEFGETGEHILAVRHSSYSERVVERRVRDEFRPLSLFIIFVNR